MTTLALNKKDKGEYEVENDNVFISISSPFAAIGLGSKEWELSIVDKKTEERLVHAWFNTKRQASMFGAKWVIENL